MIVHLYEEHGRALRRAAERHVRLRALGRGSAASSLLARDRFGKKPLYYADLGRSLLFGSELKALLAAPALPARARLRRASPATSRSSTCPHRARSSRASAKLPGGHFLLLERRPDVGRAVLGPVLRRATTDTRRDDDYVESFASIFAKRSGAAWSATSRSVRS